MLEHHKEIMGLREMEKSELAKAVSLLERRRKTNFFLDLLGLESGSQFLVFFFVRVFVFTDLCSLRKT